MPFLVRRGTDNQRLTVTPAQGEIIYTTDTKNLFVGDGTTLGGNLITGTFAGGTLSSNLNTSTFLITNSTNLTINGGNGAVTGTSITATTGFIGSYYLGSNSVTNGANLTINGNTEEIHVPTVFVNKITSNILNTNNGMHYRVVNIGSADDNAQLNLSWNTNNATDPAIKITGVNSGQFETGSIRFYSSRGTLDAPEANIPGDALYKILGSGYDGTEHSDAGGVMLLVDPTEAVTTGSVPGSLLFFIQTSNDPTTAKTMLFNSKGQLAINKLSAAAELDVNGSGIFSGYVQFGSYSTTNRNLLTPVNGMVIYNTTANKFQGYQNSGWINLDTGSAA